MNIRPLAIILATFGFIAAPAFAQTSTPMPMPKKVHLHYSCHGLRVPVTYDNVKDIAHVTYGSRKYALSRVLSADGAEYLNGKLDWWEKGNTATLSSVVEGKPDTVLATCEALPK